MPDCSCDAFLGDWVTSTAEGVRPPTWRRPSEHPGARFAPDLELFRGENLILAFCTECRRQLVLLRGTSRTTPSTPSRSARTMLATLNLEIPLERLVDFLISPEYRFWSWAIGHRISSHTAMFFFFFFFF